MIRRLRAALLRILGAPRATLAEHLIADEIEAHVDLHTEDGVRAGLTREEARRRALIRLGGAEQVKQAWRERKGMPWLESCWRDVHFGLRVLLKNSGFTATAVLTLALGLGANTAIFNLVDALFLKPLAVPHPEQLVRIYAKGPSGHYGAGFSLQELEGLRANVTSFAGLAAETHIAQLNLAGSDGSEQVSGAFVSGNYFSLLGLGPQLGRLFLPEDDKAPSQSAVVVISDRLWKAHFHADPLIVGREARINGISLTIIGVTPEGFHGGMVGLPDQVWLPSAMMAKAGFGCSDGSYNCSLIDAIVGRLAPGQSPVQAQAEARSRMVWSAIDWPERPSRRQLMLYPASAQSPDDLGDELVQMRLLMAVTISLLLVACANLAGLLLARGVTRRREIAVRMAIGAMRTRVIRQLLTESLLLALGSGGLGLALSYGLTRLLSRYFETDSEGFHHLYDLGLDWRILAYSLAVTLLMGAFFGLIPAMRASSGNLTEGLKDGGTVAGQPLSGRMRSALVVGQIALSMVLVVSAALLVRSGLDLQRGTNFDPAHMVVLRVRPELLKYSPLQVRTLIQESQRRLSETPGVESMAFMEGGEGIVWTPNGRDVQVSAPGQWNAARAGLIVMKQDVSENFFSTLRIPILRGREFTRQDRLDSPRVAIVNEALAFRLRPAGDAVGHLVIVDGQPFQIAGVSADIQPVNTIRAAEPHLYLSYWQSGATREGDIRMAIRVAGDPVLAISTIRRVIQSIDPDVPIGEDMDMSEQVRLKYTPVLLARSVMLYCGLLALCMSAIGLYSILAFTVRTRTREIGVRMALGARRQDVLWLIVHQGTRLAVAGVIVGLVAASILTRLEANLLFGVNPRDPVTYLGVAVTLFLVALAACYLPARRAASIDPMRALRME